MSKTESIQSIVLGGGCFWCTEAVFARVKGVLSVESGYCNGSVPNPTYEQVCTGRTGHNEVIRVKFNAEIVSLETLLNIFFATHDPTTLNRQGNDVGTQYRSGIYYADDAQQAIAEKVFAAVNGAGLFASPVVTEIEALQQFYGAEAYHQRYFELNPNQGYCAYVIAPKVAKFRQQFTNYLAA
jgi:peptide-methionine (S)-S-oxide reductase